jgi:peroxiredoxin
MDPVARVLASRMTRAAAAAAVVAAGVALASGAFLSEGTSPDASRGRVGTFGVLVMAHGGAPEWDRAVVDAVARARTTAGPREPAIDAPVEIAFGMADAASLQEAVSRLEARGVDRIGVVRLFVSGESWLERTRQILGLARGAPPRPPTPPPAPPVPDGSPAHARHRMEFWRLEARARFATNVDGLLDDDAMGDVIARRAVALSRAPEDEDVLVLAHGPGDDAENERWLARLRSLLPAVSRARPFRRVEAATLREDWPEARAAAEASIRAYVARANDEDGRAIVVPFRVHGFGPYARVLEGLDPVADGQGLLPDPAVDEWIRAQARRLRDGSFEAPTPPEPAVAASASGIGDRVPDLLLSDVDGTSRRLSDLDGERATVLFFSNLECPCVADAESRFREEAARLEARGVRVVSVDADPRDSAEEIRAAGGGSRWPLLRDTAQDLRRATGVATAATFVLLDAQSRIRYRGALEGGEGARTPWLLSAVDAVLAGRNPDPAETPGPGCPLPDLAPAR